MMSISVLAISFDAQDASQLAHFWAQALHRTVNDGATEEHDDRAADTVARAYRAEAVTVGRDVYFRQGRFRPREPDGFGLVAHEATHVAELLAPGGVWPRRTRSGQRDEERIAGANERRALFDGRALFDSRALFESRAQPPRLPRGSQRRGGLPTGAVDFGAVTPVSDQPVAASPSLAPREAPTPAPQQPMLAAEERTTTDTAPPPDLDTLQRSLLVELKRQLRNEFERGA